MQRLFVSRSVTVLWNRPRAPAFLSRCQFHRKRESQRCVSGCETSRSQLHCWLASGSHRRPNGSASEI